MTAAASIGVGQVACLGGERGGAWGGNRMRNFPTMGAPKSIYLGVFVDVAQYFSEDDGSEIICLTIR